ncbi:MAG: threonine/serine dehydratase [Gammaproteobacteria bacterium]|nr:threonine/serine dehydratase [Gammaproteobacteria bacterium]MDH3372797.1 threonine/serine dehydratase [Gammaproteobacteria bacterium]MDH3410596.1 threonine/serine dehydratase [Gammaproteobacteria bacterium]MDH3554115.1 threonine/serine dehydratase [Gammaproteobacteria bacterium]
MLRVDSVAQAAGRAAARIAEVVHRTPLVRSPAFSDATGADVYLKLENQQHTGSFKLRGATNCLMTLTPEQRQKGCVTASSGNHGAAVAYAMRRLESTGVIFVPEQTSSAKVDAIRSYGGEVRFFGTDGLDTEHYARRFAADNGMYYLSPYNDVEVIAGQGTCGIEIAEQLPEVDAAFIAVGGGGLMSGAGSVLKIHNPGVRLFGCQPEASAIMAKSVEAGRVLDLPSEPTLSDGTAGGVEADSVTFPLCRELVDEFVLVSEQQIAVAMREYFSAEKHQIEGAAGVAIAALSKRCGSVKGMKVVVIICGGNVSEATLKSVL